jgi:serine/threonine-protein kinase
MALNESQILAGKYRIEKLLGEGGMGAVYIATNQVLQRKVALKVMTSRFASLPAAVERFHREAITASKVSHPSIVQVFDAGSHEGSPWIAMELLEGESLAERLERGPLSLEEVMKMANGALSALAEVHAEGVVHRDLKPDNVLLIDREGDPFFVKLLDFGLARSQSLTRLTETGMIVGTIGYLAPEQITDQISTPASDVYALGVVMYEMLTRQPPFPGDSPVVVIRQILEEEPVRPTSLRSDIGGDLDALVQAMMAKDPAVRPSAKAVVETAGDLLMACSDLVRAGT